VTGEQFQDATGRALEEFAYQCHAASLLLVQSGALGPSRVARGTCHGVGSQHSWVVLGDDCYDAAATVVDPTLWSYDDTVSGVWSGPASDRPHTPHGAGSIWLWGGPAEAVDEVVTLDHDFSASALGFLDLLGPLDLNGWVTLAHAPVEGWPSKEILTAMYRDKRLRAFIPIDIVGMVTDANPGGLYLPEW
jgi:hypothetical protein